MGELEGAFMRDSINHHSDVVTNATMPGQGVILSSPVTSPASNSEPREISDDHSGAAVLIGYIAASMSGMLVGIIIGYFLFGL